MGAGRPSKLTPELVSKAEELANDGLPLAMIADAISVHPTTCQKWMQSVRNGDKCELKRQFFGAISRADRKMTKSYLGSVRAAADQGNAWAATWMLTHHPAMRDHFSDAAAERRTERRTVATVMEAVAAADLPADVEQALLLQMQARGLGAQFDAES